MGTGKLFLIHFLIWFIVVTLVLYFLGDEFFDFAVIGIMLVLAVDYIAMGRYRYIPVAVVGAILGILLNFYYL